MNKGYRQAWVRGAIIASMVLCLCPLIGYADVKYEPANAETAEQMGPDSWELKTFVMSVISSKVNARSGDVRVTDTQMEATYRTTVYQDVPFAFTVGTRNIFLDNSTDVPLPSRLVKTYAEIETTLPTLFWERTYLRLGIVPSFYADDWQCTGDQFKMYTKAYLVHLLSPQWTLLGGLMSDFNGETYPVLGAIYKPNEQWTFNLIPVKPSIIYALNDRMDLFVDGGMTRDVYKVKKGSVEGAELYYNETHLGAGCGYRFTDWAKATFSIGSMFDRTIEYDDNTDKMRIENDLYGKLSFDAKF